MNKKTWTGERLETHISNETTVEHLHRYAIALELVTNKVVLDIASGEGYGSNILSTIAKKVYGVDIDEKTIQAAKQKYKRSNLKFLVGSADKIPIEDKSIDIVVSFETIEHHAYHEEMLSEIKRVLKPNGILIMSSPDKKYYTDEVSYNNPFHIKELYEHEFKSLINHYFSNTYFFGQAFLVSSIIYTDDAKNIDFYKGNYNQLEKTSGKPVYNLAIASDNVLPKISNSLFYDIDFIEKTRDEIVYFYENTPAWRVGKVILAPFVLIRNIFKGKVGNNN